MGLLVSPSVRQSVTLFYKFVKNTFVTSSCKLALRSCYRLKEELHLESDSVDPPPTRRQLLLTAVSNALPFIGFGFLDNAVMIVAVSTPLFLCICTKFIESTLKLKSFKEFSV